VIGWGLARMFTQLGHAGLQDRHECTTLECPPPFYVSPADPITPPFVDESWSCRGNASLQGTFADLTVAAPLLTGCCWLKTAVDPRSWDISFDMTILQ